MTATDALVAACIEAISDPDARGAIREVLARSVTDGTLTSEGNETTVGLHILHRSPDLTVLNVIWPPMMSLFPHDHRMWAAIAIYGGREDNTFYRRHGDSLIPSGERNSPTAQCSCWVTTSFTVSTTQLSTRTRGPFTSTAETSLELGEVNGTLRR